MEKYLSQLKDSGLFDGISSKEITPLLGCLGARVVDRVKEQVIFGEGEPITEIGVMLSGSAMIVRHGYDGNRSVISAIGAGNVFGEAFACSGKKLSFSVEASSDCKVMLLSVRRIVSPCSNACGFHNKIIYNLLKAVAEKNIAMSRRIEVTGKRTTREKLLAYLSTEASLRGSRSFTVPYDRQALADYLEVDRSGLSVEIGKLKREGIIDCKKNWFKFLEWSAIT